MKIRIKNILLFIIISSIALGLVSCAGKVNINDFTKKEERFNMPGNENPYVLLSTEKKINLKSLKDIIYNEFKIGIDKYKDSEKMFYVQIVTNEYSVVCYLYLEENPRTGTHLLRGEVNNNNLEPLVSETNELTEILEGMESKLIKDL